MTANPSRDPKRPRDPDDARDNSPQDNDPQDNDARDNDARDADARDAEVDLDQTQPPRREPRPRGFGETTRATLPPTPAGSARDPEAAEKPEPTSSSPSSVPSLASDGDSDPRATQPMSSRTPLPRLGTFELEEKIGEGGMGVVYRAYDSELQRRVAIKKILPKFLGDRDLAQRFISEARAVAAVDHPNISQIYAIHAREESTPPYFVMEYVEGLSAADLVERDGPLSLERAVDIARQAARGLRAAERRGIIHRDVKPSNLMLTDRGVVKLVDFGLSRPINDVGDRTERGVVLGTPHYTSPEQARSWTVDHRSDIYALGCTLFYLLTGRPVFEGSSQVDVLLAHTNDPPPRLASLRSDLGPEVEAVVHRMLEKQPEMRYQDYDALLEALGQLISSEERAPVDPPRRRRPLAAAATLVVLLAGVFAAATIDRWWPARRADGESFNPREFFGDVYTPSDVDGYERLEYVFAKKSRQRLPSGLIVPARLDDPLDARGKLPSLLGPNLHWANVDEPILFPYLDRFEEVEIGGLKFSGEPDFALSIGYEPEQPQQVLQLSFHVGRRTVGQVVECLWGGEPAPVRVATSKIDFTVRENSEYIVRLKRRPSDDPEWASFLFELLLVQDERSILQQEIRFSTPVAAIPPGHIALRCEGGAGEDWKVYLSRVFVRGRLDYGRIAEEVRRGVTFR